MTINSSAPVASCSPVCAKCGALLEAANAQRIVAETPFGKRQRAIAECLATNFGAWVLHSRIIAAVYGDDVDGGPLNPRKIIDTQICISVRPRLAAHGFVIESNGKGGRRLRRCDPS